jgi:hypothetical protein
VVKEEAMSVLVIVKIAADKAAFEKLVAERGEEMKAISARGRAAGAIHHRFGLGADGTIVVLDEWNSAEASMAFFDDPEIASVMQDTGAQGPPELLIVEALETADQFRSFDTNASYLHQSWTRSSGSPSAVTARSRGVRDAFVGNVTCRGGHDHWRQCSGQSK